MATITQRGKHQWQAKIRKKGHATLTQTFDKKADAEKWARHVESEMDRGIFVSSYAAENTPLSELTQRYAEEVAPRLKSAARIILILKHLDKAMGHLMAASITPAIVKEYRDYRLEKVCSDTVRKELLVFSRLFKVAQKEWDFHLPRGNPVASIAIPAKGKARERRLEDHETGILLKAAEEYGNGMDKIITLAIETGMRRGEIVALRWDDINFIKRTALLRETKNGDNRTIPLSSTAIGVLQGLPRDHSGRVFPVRSDSVGMAFRRITARAGLENLRFHDLRHEAASRFFERGLGIMEVSTITGHKDLAMLKRYTHLKAEDIAKKLG